MKNIKRMIVAGCLGLSMAVSAHAQGPARPGPAPDPQHNRAMRSPDVIEWGKLGRGHNSFTADQARKRFEKAGYVHVSKPWLDRNGLWQATARWGDHSRKVALDYRGHLAER